jgi:uncharacterized protein with ATP-grasp and redox domains
MNCRADHNFNKTGVTDIVQHALSQLSYTFSIMKTYLDCIPCFFRQALAAAKMSTDDEMIHRLVLNSVAFMIPELALDVTPPEIAQQVYRVVNEITGDKDIYDSADVIVAKGQGNYESLCNRPENIFFFFKVKCPVIARDSGYDVGTLALIGKN